MDPSMKQAIDSYSLMAFLSRAQLTGDRVEHRQKFDPHAVLIATIRLAADEPGTLTVEEKTDLWSVY
jgi:hypothetical protein